ncbi:hypothetical protein, partial [Aminipila sp.]|uniref:hypothetical protein n=1 Tax=Aminipila sp. TaxID=2060095 RepID=UPI00289F9061
MQQLREHKIFFYLLILLMMVSMAMPLSAFADEGSSQPIKIYYRNLNKPMAVIEVTDSKETTQSFEQLKTTPGSYLSANLSMGECQYTVYKDAAKSTVVGSGSFTVTSTTSELYLCYMSVAVSYDGLSAEEWTDYEPGGSVIVKDTNGNPLTPGNISFSPDGHVEYHEYVTVAAALSEEYSYKIQPNDSKMDKGSGSFSFTNKNFLQWSGAESLKPLKNSAAFYVTKGAPFNLYSKGKAHYMPFTKYEPTAVDTSSDPSYDIYTYNNNLPPKNFHYIAGGGNSRFQKQGRYISGGNMDNKTFHVDLDTLDNDKKEDSGFIEDNLYLNVPDNKYKSLKIDESFKLEAFRVWQAVNSTYDNYFIEPDFHYEVIGDKDSVKLTTGGSPGREYETVT